MKRCIQIIVVTTLLISKFINAQNITNTLGTGGIFKVKDESTSYLSLNQVNGLVSLNNCLTIPYTTSSSFGVIYKGTERFIHNYFASGTVGNNTFVGINSGNFSMGGGQYEAINNTAVGTSSLNSLTTGHGNSAFGSGTLFRNSGGYYNSAFGLSAMFYNQTGIGNSAFGYQALEFNTSGLNNCAFGGLAVFSNSTGKENSAVGFQALFSNNSDYNTAFGAYSLYSNTSGYSNSAFGWNTLRNSLGIGNTSLGNESFYSLTNGDFNTAVGYFSGHDFSSGSNNIIIGYNAQVPNSTGSNQVRLGNAAITYAGIQVAWTVTSDRRWKENIKPSNLGLNFITQLNPVSYTRKNDEAQKTEYGLIAQDVEEVLKADGIENTGMLNVTDEGMYELRYNDLIAPIIKAIQELKKENDELVDRIKILEQKLNEENSNQNVVRFSKNN